MIGAFTIVSRMNVSKILLSSTMISHSLCFATVSDLYTKIQNKQDFMMLPHRICWSAWCANNEQQINSNKEANKQCMIFYTNSRLRDSMYREIGKAIASVNFDNNLQYKKSNLIKIVQFTDNEQIDSYTQANFNAVMLYSYIATLNQYIALYQENANEYEQFATKLLERVCNAIKAYYNTITSNKYINEKIDKAKSDISKYIKASNYISYARSANNMYFYGYDSYVSEVNLNYKTLLFDEGTNTGSFFIPNVCLKERNGTIINTDMLVSVKNGQIEYITPTKTYGAMNVYCDVEDCVSKPLSKIEDIDLRKILLQTQLETYYGNGTTVSNMCYMAASLNCLNMSKQFRDAIRQVANKETKEISLKNGTKYKLNLCKIVNDIFKLTENNNLGKNEYMLEMANKYKEFNEASAETMRCLRLKTTEDVLESQNISDQKFEQEVYANQTGANMKFGSALEKLVTNIVLTATNEQFNSDMAVAIKKLILPKLANAKNIEETKEIYKSIKQELYKQNNYVTAALAGYSPKSVKSFLLDFLYAIRFELQQYGIDKQVTTNTLMYALHMNNTEPQTITTVTIENLDSAAIINNPIGRPIVEYITDTLKNNSIANFGGNKTYHSCRTPIIELPDILIINRTQGSKNVNIHDNIQERLELKDSHGIKKYKLVAKHVTLNSHLEKHGIGKLKIGDKWYVADGGKILRDVYTPIDEETYKNQYMKDYTQDTSSLLLYYDRYE